jgi:dihydroxyacetone kinase DhaKLM complex PTS-EIIA-like component DhaM
MSAYTDSFDYTNDSAYTEFDALCDCGSDVLSVDFHCDVVEDDEEQWSDLLAEAPLVFDAEEQDRLWTVH